MALVENKWNKLPARVLEVVTSFSRPFFLMIKLEPMKKLDIRANVRPV